MDDVRGYAAAHPSIDAVLGWSASPMLATMALSRAFHGGKRAQLAFIALTASSPVLLLFRFIRTTW